MKEFFKNSHKIELSEKEKNDMRSRLVREVQSSRLNTMSEGVKSPFYKPLLTKQKIMVPAAIGLIVALALGGGVSYASADALPGDMLYPVKTELNEEVRGWFAIGDKAEAEYRGRLAEERLEEFETLVEMRAEHLGEVRGNIEARFEEHIRVMEQRLESLEEEDSELVAKISERMEERIERHQENLKRFEEGGEDLIGKFSERMEEVRARMEQRRDGIEERMQNRLKDGEGEQTQEQNRYGQGEDNEDLRSQIQEQNRQRQDDDSEDEENNEEVNGNSVGAQNRAGSADTAISDEI